MPDKFILHSNYKPTGDHPEAIEKLTKGLESAITVIFSSVFSASSYISASLKILSCSASVFFSDDAPKRLTTFVP